MRTISVITAVDPNRSEHLSQTWESLQPQTLPENWGFEWLVQCDDTSADAQDLVRSKLPNDPRISFSASPTGGPGVARTMALERANGGLVKTLDADDQLGAGVLARDIAACTQRGIIWSASRVVDEHEDGTRTPHYPYDPPAGRIRDNSLYIAYTQQDRILVHPATLCVRVDHLLALGGWMALSSSEDTGLLLALDSLYSGWFNEEIGLIYRRWGPQMSKSSEHTDPTLREARKNLIVARCRALSAVMGD